MTKPVFGMLLGGVLGVFDGLTALISAPETRPQIVEIVMGSTVKGIVAGLLIGYLARRLRSLPLAILAGAGIGAFFAYLVTIGGPYLWEIVLPGTVLGIIVGFATYQYGDAARPAVRSALLVALIGMVTAAAPLAADAKPAAADSTATFERLKSLAGRWRGHVVTPDGPTAEVHYSVTAGGNTVEEKLFPGTSHEMVSMYHLDGGDLVLTHYCAMGNQPRMRLVEASGSNPVLLRFDFTGGSNVDPAKDMHMHAGRMTLRGPDRLEAEWAVWDKGKVAGANKFFLDRVKDAGRTP